MDPAPLSPLPPEIAAAIIARLAPDERVTWSVQPIAARLVAHSVLNAGCGIPILASAILWTAFSLFGHAIILSLFGLLLVFLGLCMVVNPYFVRYRAHRTAYVITNQRALIYQQGFLGGPLLRSYTPEQLGGVECTRYSDGTGDLIFEREWRTDSDGGKVSTEIGFMAVADIDSAEAAVRAFASRAHA